MQGEELGESAHRLDAAIDEIEQETALWERTRREARAAGAPGAVLARIAQVREALGFTAGRVEKERNAIVALQSQVLERRRSLVPIRDRIDEAREALAASLSVRQNEPLWKMRPKAGEFRAGLDVVEEDVGVTADHLADYVRRYRELLIAHAILILALGWLFTRARSGLDRGASRASGEPTSSAGALRHPWAAALLVGSFATPFLHPERVLGLQILAGLVSLPVLVLVLGSMLPGAIRGALVTIAALAFVEALRIPMSRFELLDRSLLMADLTVIFGGLAWLQRRDRRRTRLERLGGSIWVRILDGWLGVFLLASGIGLVASVLGYTNLASRIAFVAVWGTTVGGGWMALARIAEALVESAVKVGQLDQLRMVRSNRQLAVDSLRRAVRTLAVVAFVSSILTATQLWVPLREAADGVLSARVGFGPVGFTLGGVLAFSLTLWLSWMLSRFVSFALDQEVFARVRMPSGVPFALATFTRYAILVVGFLAAMAMLGFSLDRVTLILSALGVGIGFGLQNVINNFVSGVILLFERPVRVGDRVELDQLVGLVTTIGIRASKVRTFDGSDVIVPNADFISPRVIDWTLTDAKRRIVLPVRVAYGTKPRQVIELLESVARENAEVLDNPAPEALFRGFGESSLDFELRAFTESERGWMPVMSDLALTTSEALETAGIQIPFPQRDLHLRNLPELQEALSEVVQGGKRGGDEPGS